MNPTHSLIQLLLQANIDYVSINRLPPFNEKDWSVGKMGWGKKLGLSVIGNVHPFCK